jgi:hypothetical protein
VFFARNNAEAICIETLDAPIARFARFIMKRYLIWRCWFCVSVSSLLLIASVAKFETLWRFDPRLRAYDPLFAPLTRAHSVVLAATLEFAVAGYILWRRQRLSSICVAAWLTSVLISYRILTYKAIVPKACGCFGKLPELLHLPANVAHALPVVVLAYIAGGSLMFLMHEWLRSQDGPPRHTPHIDTLCSE